MKNVQRLLILMLAMGQLIEGSAVTVYKSMRPDGSVMFSDHPLPGMMSEQTLKIAERHNTISSNFPGGSSELVNSETSTDLQGRTPQSSSRTRMVRSALQSVELMSEHIKNLLLKLDVEYRKNPSINAVDDFYRQQRIYMLEREKTQLQRKAFKLRSQLAQQSDAESHSHAG